MKKAFERCYTELMKTDILTMSSDDINAAIKKLVDEHFEGNFALCAEL